MTSGTSTCWICSSVALPPKLWSTSLMRSRWCNAAIWRSDWRSDALRARMWSLGMALSDSEAKPRSIECPGLFGKSMVSRAKTVSTALILPKPQLRCMA